VHETLVHVYRLLVQVHKLLVQVHKLLVQVHEHLVQVHGPFVQMHKLLAQVRNPCAPLTIDNSLLQLFPTSTLLPFQDFARHRIGIIFINGTKSDFFYLPG